MTWEGGASNENKVGYLNHITIRLFMHHTVGIQTEDKESIDISTQHFIVLCCRLVGTIIEYFFGLGCYCGYDISDYATLPSDEIKHVFGCEEFVQHME